MDLLSNYQGFRKNRVILVFDAYKVPGGQGSVSQYEGIFVVYTKERQTAEDVYKRQLQGRHAAPDQAVDLALREAHRRSAEAPEAHAVHRQGRVPLRRQPPREGRGPQHGGAAVAALVQRVGAHQHLSLIHISLRGSGE